MDPLMCAACLHRFQQIVCGSCQHRQSVKETYLTLVEGSDYGWTNWSKDAI